MSDVGNAIERLEAEIKTAPFVQVEEPVSQDTPPCLDFTVKSGVPKRYRQPDWLPTDKDDWKTPYMKARKIISAGATLSLIGGRGTGKTRLAIEVCRRLDAKGTRYLSAMDVFLRLQACYRKDANETELAVLQELSKVRLLIIDEVQERGNTEWEDRVLTHLIDKRYGAMLPTVLIANLKPAELRDRLGASIMDRMHEGGGMLEIAGDSHRRK